MSRWKVDAEGLNNGGYYAIGILNHPGTALRLGREMTEENCLFFITDKAHGTIKIYLE